MSITQLRSFLRTHRTSCLAILLACALALRCAVVGFQGIAFTSDSFAYIRMAEAIRLGYPESLFPNGYPLLIALLRTAVPIAALPTLLVGLNVLLSTGTVACVYDLGRRVGTVEVGFLGAAALAVYPNHLNYVRYVLTDVPAAFLVTLALALFLRKNPALSGVAAGLALVLRTSLLPFAVLLGLLCLRPFSPSATPARGARRWASGAALVLGIYGFLLALGVVAPSSNAGVNLLIATASWSHEGVDYTPDGFSPAERAHPLRTYLHALWEHPGRFVGQRLSSLWELWGPWPYDAEGNRGIASQVLIGLRFPVLLLGTGAAVRRRSTAALALLTPAACLTVVHVAFFSAPRFTVPAEPALLVLSALGLWTLFRFFRRRC